MANLFTDGAESGDLLFWENRVNLGIATGRISGYCYSVGNGSQALKSFTPASEFFVRFAFQWPAAQPIRCAWMNAAGSAELGSIRPTVNGFNIYVADTLVLAASGPANTLEFNVWYLIELHVKIADAGGVIEYKIDGISRPGYSGDTKPGADTTAGKIYWSGYSGTSQYVDDLALNDTTGPAPDNTWCGDGHLYGLILSGNGDSSQWMGSDGNSVDNYLLVDDVGANGDTDYVSSVTPGQVDLYQVANLPTLPAGSTIRRVIVDAQVREITADADTMQVGLKAGGVEQWSSDQVLTTTYDKKRLVANVNPSTSVAWTESEVNAMQIGIKAT